MSVSSSIAGVRSHAGVAVRFAGWVRLSAIVGSIGLVLIIFDSPLGTGRQLLGLAIVGLVAVLSVTLRPASRAALATALVAGTLGFSIALGYSVSHVVESSVGAAAIGVASTLAWLVVLAAALSKVLRDGSWLVRIATVLSALIALQLVVLPVAAGTAGAHAPRMPVTVARPDGASEVVLSVAPGVELHGWYTPGTNGAGVVLLPGSDGNRGQTIDHAAVLNRGGYTVLALDARGSGDSTGYANLWGWDGYEDLTAAINWLQEQPAMDPARVGVVGLSMGGEEALTAVPLDHRIHAAVAEGVQGRVPADTWFIGDDPRALVERSVDGLAWIVADLWTETPAPAPLRDVAAAVERQPVLLIAADAPDERAVAADLAQRSSLIDVWQTNGIGHTQALALAPVEWEQRVISFLNENLLADQ